MISDLKNCFKKRLLIFLPVGFFSGLPLLLTSATLGTWLADLGVNKTTIGLFALVGMPYALKFLWAPLLDIKILNFFSNRVGIRRVWIIIMQILICINIFIIGNINPVEDTKILAFTALTLAFFSASHDVAIDAWRIEIHKKSEYGLGAAMYVTGYRIALLVAGAGALIIAEIFSWKISFISLSALFPLGILLISFCNIKTNENDQDKAEINYKNFFKDRVIEPFKDFMNKNNWVLILVFIAFIPFITALFSLIILKEKLAQITIYTMIAAFLGVLIISRLGIILSLFIAGILQLLSNLVFILLAIKGSSISLLVITITIENLSGGIGTAAFIAYLSSLCNVQFSAFQYALLSSFMAFSRTWLEAPAGWLIDNLKWQRYFENFGINQINNPEWVGFFIITALFCLPAIILIYYIDNKRKIN